MGQEITLTTTSPTGTSPNRYIVRDLFRDSDWPFFDEVRAREYADPVPHIGLVEFKVVQHSVPRDMDILYDSCLTEVEHWVFDANDRPQDERVWLFKGHNSWIPRSRVALHKRLWKTLPADFTTSEMDLGREVMFESAEGIRFAGIAAVNRNTFRQAMMIVRNDSGAAVVMSRRNEIEESSGIEYIYHCAFPPQRSGKRRGVDSSTVNWMTLAVGLCPLGDVVLRLTGDYDERQVSCDCFMSSETVAGFENCDQFLSG